VLHTMQHVDDPAVQLELADMAERAATAIDSLVDDLVSAGAPSNESLPLRRRSFDLADLVRAAVESLAAARGFRAELDVPDALVVYADERAVGRIVQNLLDNARRHGDPPVRVRVERYATDVVIEVSNAGAVPSELRPHLFTRYRPGARSSSGSGLGLHIVQRLAAAHRGTVELVAEPTGRDRTCIRVTLPQRGDPS
jgi:two-component system, OmpR family, sensor histidine kinase MtrB